VHGQVDCQWSHEPCAEPWVPGSQVVWVDLGVTPPCSVKMTLYYSTRCGQIEFQDLSIGPLLITAPSQCAGYDELMFQLRYGTVRESIIRELLTIKMASMINESPGCCPCALGWQEIVVAKIGACYKPILTYRLLDGTMASRYYDTDLPWSYYESQMMMQGGVDPIITIEKCPGTGCCYKKRLFCVTETSEVQYWDNPWYTVENCQFDPEGQCVIQFCD
jgi:hypothetical protein